MCRAHNNSFIMKRLHLRTGRPSAFREGISPVLHRFMYGMHACDPRAAAASVAVATNALSVPLRRAGRVGPAARLMDYVRAPEFSTHPHTN